MKLCRAICSWATTGALALVVAIPARSEAPSAVPGADAFPANAAGPAASFPSSSAAAEPPVPFTAAPEPQGTVSYAPTTPVYVPATPASGPATGLQIQGL